MAQKRKGISMKKLLKALLLILSVTILVTSVSAASVSPALNIIAGGYSMTVSALSGETVEFTDRHFADAAGLINIKEVKVVELPDEKQGILYLNDAPVSVNQVIPVSDIKNVRFVPEKDSKGASFKFTFDGEYTMTCNIVYGKKANNAPAAGENVKVSTYSGTVCGGHLNASDADGDSIKYEIVKYPEKGNIEINSSTGEFRYTPTAASGTDTIEYKAVDENGAYSEIAAVNVNILENKSGTVFSDMKNDTRATAAISMSDKGIMTFDDKDGKKVFSPEENVSRLDFLVSAMNIFGASNIPTVKSTGFKDDSDIPAKYKGYVYSAAKLGIISGVNKEDGVYFYPNKTVTAAEAATILNNVIGYEPKSISSISPQWASEAVCAMNELGVYSPENKTASMNKADTAQMLYCVNNLLYE